MMQVFASFVLNFGLDILDCGILQEVTKAPALIYPCILDSVKEF